MGAGFARTAQICGIPVSGPTVVGFMDWMVDRALNQPVGAKPVVATYLNAHCTNLASKDSEYYRILTKADCVYPDGQSIVWASHFVGEGLPERVNAGDFIVRLLGKFAEKGIRVGLVGGRPGVAKAAAAKWQSLVPGLKIGLVHNGFEERDVPTAGEEEAVDVLLVGMGSPLQETWAWEHRSKLKCRVVWCVGALFEYFGEDRRRAPVWMRRAGLEWVMRLSLEPKRLWRRYLIGNVRFCWLVLWHDKHGLWVPAEQEGD